MSSLDTSVVLDDIRTERARQDLRWGIQSHPNGTGNTVAAVEALSKARATCDLHVRCDALTFADILTEEFCEAMVESDPEKLRAELVQVAAVAAAWIEAIDRRSKTPRD
jgi:hypothetical protein